MKQYAIYHDADKSENLVDEIISYLIDKDKVFDVYFFTNSIINTNNKNIACLPTFYMKFYRNSIIFCNVDDYIEHKDNIIAENIYLLTSLDELLSRNMDKNSLNNTTLLYEKDGKIYEV